MTATQIPPTFVPKVWGSLHLEPWFRNVSEKIGEVWFPADDLLVKFLFTSENLSVQVHPDDVYARENENSRGKTEMWHILRAEPGAKVAAGFRHRLSGDEVRTRSLDGRLMDDLAWHQARAGETYFIPAGTVHAIGAGLALCEVQQNSDVTYRLFDYGRPRELHLDRALDVADVSGHGGACPPRDIGAGYQVLVESAYFVTERLVFGAPRLLPGGRVVIVLSGSGSIGGQTYRAGTVWEVPAAGIGIDPEEPTSILLTYKP